MQDVLLLGLPGELGHGVLIQQTTIKPAMIWHLSQVNKWFLWNAWSHERFAKFCPRIWKRHGGERIGICRRVQAKKDLLASTEVHLGETPELSPIERKFSDPLYIATQPSPVCLCVCVYRLAVTESRNSYTKYIMIGYHLHYGCLSPHTKGSCPIQSCSTPPSFQNK